MINVNKLKKLLSVLLAVALLLSCTSLAALAEETEAQDETEEEFIAPDELVVAHPTITKGDFFTEMFGNDTADIDVRALIHGYNLVNWDQNQGTYVFDPSVVRQVQAGTRSDDEGNQYKEYDLVIADNLKYSNGEPITAWDYAFSILLMMSPEIEQIGGKIYRAEHLAGYDDYIAARRKVIAGDALDEAVRQGGAVGNVLFAEGQKVHAPGETIRIRVREMDHQVAVVCCAPRLIVKRFRA